MIFITINNKQSIIVNVGYYKMIFFTIGITCYFISNFFITYSNYRNCSLNFLLKHIGVSLPLIIFYIFISLGYELGIMDEEDEKFRFVSTYTSTRSITSSELHKNSIDLSSSNSDIDHNNRRNSIRKNCLINQEKEFIKNSMDQTSSNTNQDKDNNVSNILSNGRNSIKKNPFKIQEKDVTKNSTDQNRLNSNLEKDTSITFPNRTNSHRVKSHKNQESDFINNIKNTSNTLLPHDNTFTNENREAAKERRKKYKHLIKCIRSAHSLYLEVLFVYPFFIISLIMISIIYKMKENKNNNNHIIQSKDGQWFYKCDLENNDIIYYLLEFIILVFVLLKGIKILNYECIFKCTKYIAYAAIVDIAIGPIVNVI